MIAREFSNSIDRTAANLAAQHAAAAKSAAQRRQSYRVGFDAYCKSLRLADLSDRDEIRGWWAALDTGADCETDGYLHPQDPGPGIEDDVRFLAYEF